MCDFFPGLAIGNYKVFLDLKQIDWQIFLRQMWVYSGSAENCNLGSATMGSHMQVPTQNMFIEQGRKLGEGAVVNKEFMAFHCLSSCQERRWIFFLLGSAMVLSVRAPLSGLPTLFNWGFCLLIFYNFIRLPFSHQPRLGTQLVHCSLWKELQSMTQSTRPHVLFCISAFLVQVSLEISLLGSLGRSLPQTLLLKPLCWEQRREPMFSTLTQYPIPFQSSLPCSPCPWPPGS